MEVSCIEREINSKISRITISRICSIRSAIAEPLLQNRCCFYRTAVAVTAFVYVYYIDVGAKNGVRAQV